MEDYEGGNEDSQVALLVVPFPFLERLDFVLPEGYRTTGQ